MNVPDKFTDSQLLLTKPMMSTTLHTRLLNMTIILKHNGTDRIFNVELEHRVKRIQHYPNLRDLILRSTTTHDVLIRRRALSRCTLVKVLSLNRILLQSRIAFDRRPYHLITDIT